MTPGMLKITRGYTDNFSGRSACVSARVSMWWSAPLMTMVLVTEANLFFSFLIVFYNLFLYVFRDIQTCCYHYRVLIINFDV